MQRPHPHVQIPPGSSIPFPNGARPPINPNSPPGSPDPYAFEQADSSSDRYNPWAGVTPTMRMPEVRIGVQPPSRRGSGRSGFYPHDANTPPLAFPEPQLYRSVSQREPLTASRSASAATHRPARSDELYHANLGRSISATAYTDTASVNSWEDDYEPFGVRSQESIATTLSQELSQVTLESEEGLLRFQSGGLAESDQEWYRLVPETAREALGKDEVQRQSVLFEVFKSQRDYVSDLELVREVFIEPLRAASPPVIPPERLDTFIHEVFWNVNEILAHESRMLAALFARQRDQHPLLQSVTDIILDNSLLFRDEYESYIKHYPLAEARHRRELRRNAAYATFISSQTEDRRTKKRDLITFISRAVTRLPRLNLILETVEKRTPPDHPDKESLPVLFNILSDFIKSTQPGIAAAESKVKFWTLCESLVYRRGEIIDMDLYNDRRTLVYQGSVARRRRSDTVFSEWSDLVVGLLDHYLLICSPETRSNGIVKHSLASRPLPLDYLRLGSFTDEPENRRETTLGLQTRPVYPFTVYHASAKSARRYTFYADSETIRNKWRAALVDAMALRKAQQEANKWFAVNTLNDGFFRLKTPQGPRGASTGKITSATPLSAAGRNYLAVACQQGIFVVRRGNADFQLALNHSNSTQVVALDAYNKVLVHQGTDLFSYSADLMVRMVQGNASARALEASQEKVAGKDGSVTFFRAGEVARRMIVLYSSKSFLQTTLQALEVLSPSQGAAALSPVRSKGLFGSLRQRQHETNASQLLTFQPFGKPFYVPKEAFDATTLVKTVAISTEKGLIILDPTNLGAGNVTVVPDFNGAGSDNAMASLKTRCEAAKPLGLVRSGKDELLVVYEEFGCYITKHGAPTRSCGFVHWETKATSFAARGSHILLFSPEFIEVREVLSSRLMQVIEGHDVRLLHTGPPDGGPVLLALRGEKNDADGLSDRLAELVETVDLTTPVARDNRGLWDEWDM